MAAPSMVSRNGDTLVVRSVVSGDALFGTSDDADRDDSSHEEETDDIPSGGESTELPQCKIRRNYSCSACDYYTQNPRFYLYHQKQVHNEKIKIFECPHCLYASKHSQKLQRHVHMVHVVGRKNTPRVKKVLKVKEKTSPPPRPAKAEQDEEEEDEELEPPEEPIFTTDGTQVYKCSVCDMTSKSQALVARHERVVHLKKKIFRCSKCNYMTHMKARYTKHVKYHSMPMIKCDMCDFKTPYKWNLDRHNKNHQGDGPYKCTMCNFSAEIKQSLTVHEMNHHVPPVGHMASGNRRRLRVGASDTQGMATEEDCIDQDELDLLKMEREGVLEHQNPGDYLQTQLEESSSPQPQLNSNVRLTMKQVLVPVGQKVNEKRCVFQIQKFKCKVCDFQGSVGEVQRHELQAHNLTGVSGTQKKTPRPIPNLIPIQGQSILRPLERKSEDIGDAYNSTLKDFALIMDGKQDSLSQTSPSHSVSSFEDSKETFKKKNASFFDKLKEKLMTNTTEKDLTCSYCNFEAKCLSEHIKHQKLHFSEEEDNGGNSFQGELSSTRCQHCRHRCKTSADLIVHLRNCAALPLNTDGSPPHFGKMEVEDVKENNHQDEEENVGHPMENKVFVWNTMNDNTEGITAPFELNFYQRNEDRIALESLSKQSYQQIAPRYQLQPVQIQPREVTKRVFKCPNCPFWASTASRFHVHIVGHLNKRPFQCSLCHYSSNWRWDITKHIRLKQMRDSAHERAKVLLTDEAGRRNYSKYNKYLVPISADEVKRAHQPKKVTKEGQNVSNKSSTPTKRRSEDEQEDTNETPKKKLNSENKRTMWKCKKCLFRNSDRNVVLSHVKGHYRNPNSEKTSKNNENKENTPQSPKKESTSPPQSPKTKSEDGAEDNECPDFMCETCPFVCGSLEELDQHSEKHFVAQGRNERCQFCPFYAENSQQLMEHLDLHSSAESEEAEGKNEIFACFHCPYVAVNHQQLVYHRQWHTKTLPHKCMKCSYSTHNNIILSLHVRLHGKNFTEADGIKKNANVISADISGTDTSSFSEIPMVWVSKPMGISKMFKCRFCPHVNMRKINIQEHEKMHSTRTSTGSNLSVLQHHCSDCNYICNNAGVLSSHIKVHQAFFGQVCGIVDNNKSDEEQIEEMKKKVSEYEAALKKEKEKDKSKDEERDKDEEEEDFDEGSGNESDYQKGERVLHFCPECPARFLYGREVITHMRFHSLKLPFKCEACSYTARQASHLLAHFRVHTDVYQERTSVLFDSYPSDLKYPRPKIAVVLSEPGDPSFNSRKDSVWVVVGSEDSCKDKEECRDEMFIPDGNQGKPRKTLNCPKCPAEFYKDLALEYHKSLHGGSGPHKCKYCDYAVKTYGNLLRHEAVHVNSESQVQLNIKSGAVPTSGTELFKQKSEVQKTISPPKSAPLQKDPEFGSLIFGNPDFYYPTYMKNGRLREKRYKCHKCPSAFEKREQYKVHLSLHGSKQRYNCERCDYSVKYFANYSQHVKKHSINDSMKKKQEEGKKLEDETYDDEREIEESASPPITDRCSKSMNVSIADQQSMMLMQLRNVSNNLSRDTSGTEVVNRCSFCPYTYKGKEGVSRHMKCHSISNNGHYKCKYCDYNVPKLHFLKEHLKLHFAPNKLHKPEAFMKCDHVEIWSEPIDPKEKRGKVLLFKDKGVGKKDRFLPPMEPRDDFDNIKGRIYINLKTGEEEVELDEEEEALQKELEANEKEMKEDMVKIEENGHNNTVSEEENADKMEVDEEQKDEMETEVDEKGKELSSREDTSCDSSCDSESQPTSHSHQD